ncbi:hypothetical protein AB6A40_007436 [Gnathostoma spinigerum]|uniref:Teneurin-like YD-shell domain-containing protein n=1 Tax=Gnathostoma spinigerum TaxID=75299 RepID=A0ABD6ENF1_9BILA
MEVSYDNQNRITSSAHGMKADFLRRKFLYPKGSLWTPSNVQLPSGERYRIRYDHHGDVSSIKTPSGDIHLFSRHASLDRIIRRYISPYANNSYIWTNDDEGRPREYFTPDGIHALVTAYDLYGRPTRIGGTADDITFKYLQFNGGDLPVEVQGRTYRRNIVRQGPLPIEVQETRSYISHGQKRFPECSATFTYEYDDFFRISSIATNIDGETIDLVRYEYDTRTGRLSKLGNFAFLEDGSIRRILGEKIVIEVDLREDRLERRRKILVNDIQTVQMSAEYDAIGRLEAIQWTIMGERRPTEKRSYNIDGMLTQLTMGESTDRRWTCYYDLDGRLKAVNDNKLILGPGGIPIMFGQLEYETDENGWVKRRGSVYFEMDVYGRVSRVFETNGIDIEYGYDEMSRIIWRRDGEGRFDRYFYAIHDRPYLISHFTSTSVSGVSEIFYDTYGIPIALRSSKTVFSIVTDPDHNVRFIFDNFGKLIREVVRNPLGHMIVDSNPTFVFPLGFMSSFDDSLTRIVIIGKNARPLDTYTGRFMTTPPEFDFTTASLFHPERICDPFRIFDAKTSEPLMIPFEIDQWMEMSGFSLSNVVPSVRHHSESSSNLILPDWNSPSTVCETSLVISPAFCSIPKKIVHFSQFLSVSASLVIPSVPPTASSGHPMTFSPFDSIGFRGIIFSSLSNKSVSIFAPYADILTKEALNSLFNECFRVPTDDLVGDPASEYLRESHFVSSTKPPDSSVYALLGDLFNISSKADKLTLQAGKTAIIIHFNSNIIKVRRELLEERKFWMEPRIWMLEAERARSNRSTRHAWTDTQLAELRSSGRNQKCFPCQCSHSNRHHPFHIVLVQPFVIGV